MFYSVYTLFISTMSIPWRYSIICSSSSRRFTVCLVTHRCVEPFLISWLSGHYVMISVMHTPCIIIITELLYLRSCTVVPSVERYYDVLLPTCYYQCLYTLFSVTYCYYHPLPVRRVRLQVLYYRSVGAAFLIFMDNRAAYSDRRWLPPSLWRCLMLRWGWWCYSAVPLDDRKSSLWCSACVLLVQLSADV